MNNIISPLTFNPRVSKLENDQRRQRHYQNLKPAYQVMNWKNYALNNRQRNISHQEADRMSAKTSARQPYSPPYFDHQQYQSNSVSHLSAKKAREQSLRLSNVSHNSRREQHAQRLKQDAIRRVKMLQQKVLPMITTDKYLQDQNEQYGLAWQMKMQQKLVRIETAIDGVRNQMEVKYEKRLIEMQRQWEDRINMLIGEGGLGMFSVSGMTHLQDSQQQYEQQERNEFITTSTTTTTKPTTSKYNYYRSGFTCHNPTNKQSHTEQNN